MTDIDDNKDYAKSCIEGIGNDSTGKSLRRICVKREDLLCGCVCAHFCNNQTKGFF